MSADRQIDFKSNEIKLNLDCNFNFPIDFAPKEWPNPLILHSTYPLGLGSLGRGPLGL